MQKLISICTFLLAFAGTTANAADVWKACNACSESQSYRAALRAAPANTAGRSNVYVMDFERESLRKYEVTTWYEYRERMYMTFARSVPTESHIAFEFAQGVRGIKHDVAALEAGTPIPGDIAPSAFDVVHNALVQRRVSDYINEHLTFWQSIGAPVSVPLQAFGKIVDLNFIVSVTFSDGSTAKLALTGLEGSITEISYTFELVDGSARDADGNLIPSTSSEAAPYSGIFSSQAYADHMSDFIVRWYSEGSAQVQCRSEVSPGGVTVTCKRR